MEFGFPELAAIRLGFGLSPHHQPPADADAVLAGLARSAPDADAVTLDEARAVAIEMVDLARASRDGDTAAHKKFNEMTREMHQFLAAALQIRLARALDDPGGFGERLVQFWADHFTIRPNAPAQHKLAISFVDETIRPHINGRFEDMLVAADLHPMMLLYLDQINSVGPNSRFGKMRAKQGKLAGLNENLAREAMELHSLGVGAGYSQEDVRELAELLTGITYKARDGVEFLPNRAEPGAETILGKSYGGGQNPSIEDIRAAFVDLARRPEAAAFLSRKLAVHFTSDDVDEDLVAAMTARWRETQGHLPEVYRVMITHPALVDSFRHKARQPFDFIAAGLRALGVTGAELRAWDKRQVSRFLVQPMAKMGQKWQSPIGPNGWPEEAAAWITPQTLAARINWILDIQKGVLRDKLPDPRDLLVTAFGGTQSEILSWAVPKAESAREGIALILASNDFNRR